MKIGIIGTGEIGSTLTRRLTRLRHTVSIANSRGPGSAAPAIASFTPPITGFGQTVPSGPPRPTLADLAKELGPRQIRVNSINPGATATEGARTAGVIGVGSDSEKQMIAMTPLGRIGQPSDIAPTAVFLASDESGWLTGEVICASGGWR